MTAPLDWHETARRLRNLDTGFIADQLQDLDNGVAGAGADLIEEQAALITSLQAELHQERTKAADDLFAQGSELVVTQMDTDTLRADWTRMTPVVDAAVTWIEAADRLTGPDATIQNERDHDTAGDQLEAATRTYITGRR